MRFISNLLDARTPWATGSTFLKMARYSIARKNQKADADARAEAKEMPHVQWTYEGDELEEKGRFTLAVVDPGKSFP